MGGEMRNESGVCTKEGRARREEGKGKRREGGGHAGGRDALVIREIEKDGRRQRHSKEEITRDTGREIKRKAGPIIGSHSKARGIAESIRVEKRSDHPTSGNLDDQTSPSGRKEVPSSHFHTPSTPW